MKRFLVIWFGQFISNVGNGITAFSLGVYAFEKTQSATVYSLIILFAFLPSYILKPIGGALSDRFNRKAMIMIGDTGAMLGLVFILLLFLSGNQQMWVIYTGVAFSSVFMAIQNPAYKASVTDLVNENQYAKASGLMQMSESSRFLLSPIIAGFLFHFIKIEYILMIDVSTFIVAIITVFAVIRNMKDRTIRKASTNLLKDFLEGFKYTFSQKGLFWLLSITSVVTFAVGFMQALMGPMILAFTDSKTFGIILTVSASGMLASSFFIGIFSKSNGQIKILAFSLAIAGLFYGLFGSSVNVVFITISGFLFFSALPFINTSLEVIIRKNVSNEFQGRVWSIVSLISQLGMIIAFSISGILADKVFNPMFQIDGVLASTLGRIIGVGQGRGIGFLFVLSGILIMIIAIVLSKNKSLRTLETVKA